MASSLGDTTTSSAELAGLDAPAGGAALATVCADAGTASGAPRRPASPATSPSCSGARIASPEGRYATAAASAISMLERHFDEAADAGAAEARPSWRRDAR